MKRFMVISRKHLSNLGLIIPVSSMSIVWQALVIGRQPVLASFRCYAVHKRCMAPDFAGETNIASVARICRQ